MVPCEDNKPAQSRLLLPNVRQVANYDGSLTADWTAMQGAVSCLFQDIALFPFNRHCVQDCTDFMSEVLKNRSVATRSSQNWGLVLYYRLLLQHLLPPDEEQWNAIFRYVSREVCRTVVEYTADVGALDTFSGYFRRMLYNCDRFIQCSFSYLC